MRRPRIFWVIVRDDSRNIYNLHNPISDDREWNNAVSEAQQAGHSIRCETPAGTLSRDDVINQMSQIGYTLSEIPILEPPEDRSASYSGSLPQYAQGANRRRVVRIICRGECSGGHTSWAEMNIDYPGEDILRNMDGLQVTATCLSCGYIAHDPYNWFR